MAGFKCLCKQSRTKQSFFSLAIYDSQKTVFQKNKSAKTTCFFEIFNSQKFNQNFGKLARFFFIHGFKCLCSRLEQSSRLIFRLNIIARKLYFLKNKSSKIKCFLRFSTPRNSTKILENSPDISIHGSS